MTQRISFTNFLIWAIALHALYLAYTLVQGPALLNDSREYLIQALNISKGYLAYCGDTSLPVNYFDYSKRPPFYPFLLWLSGANYFWWGILLLQNLLSVWVLSRLRSILLRLGVYRPLWFGLIVSSSVPYFVYVNSIMSEILLIAAVTGMLWSYFRFWLQPGVRWVWLYNTFLLVAVFTKPVFFPFLAINLAFWGIFYRKYAWGSLLPLLIVALFFWRNKEVTGKAHFSSIAYINLLDYNAYYFNVESKGADYANQVADAAHQRLNDIDGFPAKVQYMQDVALNEISRDELAYFWFHLKGAFRGMLDPGNFDLRSFLGEGTSTSSGFLKALNEKGWSAIPDVLSQMSWQLFVLMAVSLLNKLLLMVGFVFFILRQSFHPLWKWFLTGLVFYVVLITGPINASRFMLAVWPVMVLCFMQAFLPPAGDYRNSSSAITG